MMKVDDTPVGIEAGLTVGMWTIGVARTGNEMGLSLAGLNVIPVTERARLDGAYERLTLCDAHYVGDGAAEIFRY